MSKIAKTTAPPYYAVIFSNHLSDDTSGYEQMAQTMVELAAKQARFLGVEWVREGLGITVSYWDSLQAIHNWKQNAEHQQAQRLGREKWYSDFRVRIAKVGREYSL